MNDPAGIALMIGMIDLAAHDDASFVVALREFAVEMGIGTATGLAGGFLLVHLLRRVRLPSQKSLYPVLALALAGALYGVTALAHGSGFLAVSSHGSSSAARACQTRTSWSAFAARWLPWPS